MPAKENLYSLRINRQDDLCCAHCDAAVGKGPVGFRDEAALCDLCTLDASAGLGLALILIAFARACAQGHKSNPKTSFFLVQLMLCARLFDNFCKREGFEERFPGVGEG